MPSPTAASSPRAGPSPASLKISGLSACEVPPPARPTGRCARTAHQRPERERAQQRLYTAAGRASTARPAPCRTEPEKSRQQLQPGQGGGEPQSDEAQFAIFVFRHCFALLRRSHVLEFARHVVLVVLGQKVLAANSRRRIAPSATTPEPSTNRSGTIPAKTPARAPRLADDEIDRHPVARAS